MVNPIPGVTLTQHILKKQSVHPSARGQFSALLTQIGVAGKLITAQVRRAGLIELWGSTGETNVQGETVQKLDAIAQSIFVDVLTGSGCVAVMASEEEDDLIHVPENLAGSYVVMFDPLDGSSNIDANVSIGTIFAIYRRKSKDALTEADVLRPGREMIAAGYVLYGSSTVFVLSDGQSVDAFTLDPASGEYFLTRENIRMPDKTKCLSINECNEPYWPRWVKPYLDSVIGRNTEEKRLVSGRHIGSLVADFHRNLMYGGVYLYPVDTRGKAKLRVLYECNPLAFIAEAAGGTAHADGSGRILDIEPKSLHERCGLLIGGKTEVAAALAMIEKYR